jgi:hypothetical protein
LQPEAWIIRVSPARTVAARPAGARFRRGGHGSPSHHRSRPAAGHSPMSRELHRACMTALFTVAMTEISQPPISTAPARVGWDTVLHGHAGGG